MRRRGAAGTASSGAGCGLSRRLPAGAPGVTGRLAGSDQSSNSSRCRWRGAMKPADVRPVATYVRSSSLLGRVGLLVPVLVLLGDAEVDERPVPDVSETHNRETMLALRT